MDFKQKCHFNLKIFDKIQDIAQILNSISLQNFRLSSCIKVWEMWLESRNFCSYMLLLTSGLSETNLPKVLEFVQHKLTGLDWTAYFGRIW